MSKGSSRDCARVAGHGEWAYYQDYVTYGATCPINNDVVVAASKILRAHLCQLPTYLQNVHVRNKTSNQYEMLVPPWYPPKFTPLNPGNKF